MPPPKKMGKFTCISCGRKKKVDKVGKPKLAKKKSPEHFRDATLTSGAFKMYDSFKSSIYIFIADLKEMVILLEIQKNNPF